MLHMVEGLQHVHSRGIAHLDMKPENMLLDASGTLMISDFGLATRMPPAQPILKGTQQFAAPELTIRAELGLNAADGFAVDVWALGVTVLMISIKCNPFA